MAIIDTLSVDLCRYLWIIRLCSGSLNAYAVIRSQDFFMIIKKTIARRLIFYSGMMRIIMFSATFSNNSVISWRSVLLLEETGVSGENNRPAANHWQNLSREVVSSAPRNEWDWTGICKSNYKYDHTHDCPQTSLLLLLICINCFYK